MCNAGGELKTHSNVVVELYSLLVHDTNFCSLTKASYITNINHTTPTIDIVEPNRKMGDLFIYFTFAQRSLKYWS